MAQQIIKKGIADDAVGAAKVLLENNTYLRGRNAADNADVNIIKVNASDELESSVNLNLTATPTAANHVAKRSTISGFYTEINEIPTGLVNGANTTFVVSFTPAIGSLNVYLNGVRLIPTTDWTLATLTITLAAAPVVAQVVSVSYLKEN